MSEAKSGTSLAVAPHFASLHAGYSLGLRLRRGLRHALRICPGLTGFVEFVLDLFFSMCSHMPVPPDRGRSHETHVNGEGCGA